MHHIVHGALHASRALGGRAGDDEGQLREILASGFGDYCSVRGNPESVRGEIERHLALGRHTHCSCVFDPVALKVWKASWIALGAGKYFFGPCCLCA